MVVAVAIRLFFDFVNNYYDSNKIILLCGEDDDWHDKHNCGYNIY